MRRTVRAAGETVTSLNLQCRSPVELLSRKVSATSLLAGAARRRATTQSSPLQKPSCSRMLSTNAITPLVLAITVIAIFPDSPQKRLVQFTRRGINPVEPFRIREPADVASDVRQRGVGMA